MLSKALFIIALSLLPACATVEPLKFEDSKVTLAWPLPPNEPRIKFLRAIQGPGDILPPRGKIKTYFDKITGESDETFAFQAPFGLGGDGDSLLFVADSEAGIVHKYDFQSRQIDYLYEAGDELLSSPVAVAVDADKNVYVSDSLNAKVYKYNKNGKFLAALMLDKPFLRPAGIAVDKKGRKYIVDVLAHKLYMFDKDDRFTAEFPKESEIAALSYPSNVAVDDDDNVYVTDSLNFTVKVFSPGGELRGKIAEIGDAPGSFARPKGIAVDGDGHVYAVDAALDMFQIFDRNGTFLMHVGQNGSAPGQFYLPSGIYIDKKGRIFVADTYNRRVQVFQYLKEGNKQ